jgi:transcriptional regulator with XRE-family HTH domain
VAGKLHKGDPHLDAFGQRVRELREAKQWSQELLADKAKIHRVVIGRIERGERDVGLSHLWKLAAALGVRPRDLLPDD